MKKTVMAGVATAAIAFSLSACSIPTMSTDNSGAAPASVAANAKNQSGFFTKKVGEKAGLTNQDGSALADFWVTKITVDPKCDQYMSRSSGKHTVVLDVTVQTHTAQDATAFSVLPGLINPFSFSTKGSDGVTNQSEFGVCTTPKSLPNIYTANNKYTGQIEFETPDERGFLQLTDTFSNGNGWEWSY